MIRIPLPPYNINVTEQVTSAYESERHAQRDADLVSSQLRFQGAYLQSLQVGDLIVLFPLFGRSVPFQFDLTGGGDPGDFYFDVGLAYQGADVTFDSTFFASFNVGNPAPADARTPFSLIRTDPNRRVKTIDESLSLANGLERFQDTLYNYDVVLTVTNPPSGTNFTQQFNMISVTRRNYDPS